MVSNQRVTFDRVQIVGEKRIAENKSTNRKTLEIEWRLDEEGNKSLIIYYMRDKVDFKLKGKMFVSRNVFTSKGSGGLFCLFVHTFSQQI